MKTQADARVQAGKRESKAVECSGERRLGRGCGGCPDALGHCVREAGNKSGACILWADYLHAVAGRLPPLALGRLNCALEECGIPSGSLVIKAD
ncbi:MAG: hypothetical protein QXH27_05140 [Candidatus Micrarchaeia archaeon]